MYGWSSTGVGRAAWALLSYLIVNENIDLRLWFYWKYCINDAPLTDIYSFWPECDPMPTISGNSNSNSSRMTGFVPRHCDRSLLPCGLATCCASSCLPACLRDAYTSACAYSSAHKRTPNSISSSSSDISIRKHIQARGAEARAAYSRNLPLPISSLKRTYYICAYCCSSLLVMGCVLCSRSAFEITFEH